MNAYLEKAELRFHRRLLRYHKLGLAVDVAEGAFLAALYHAVCCGIELFAVAYHEHQVRKMRGAP